MDATQTAPAIYKPPDLSCLTWAAAIYLNIFRGPVDANVTSKYTLQSPKNTDTLVMCFGKSFRVEENWTGFGTEDQLDVTSPAGAARACTARALCESDRVLCAVVQPFPARALGCGGRQRGDELLRVRDGPRHQTLAGSD